ncbi:hypothetical protein [Candidatus Tisiphia endosymbiont of Nemotelus uliginosus]|uniref:hypothetical protein n=1 Tax=Candidatus Tisiphia endosymbiont of Nemotelus uliginosus TaxID=3077926 RepID=UPI0035C88FBB
MQQLVSSLSTSTPVTINNSDNNAIIYYNFVGNFVPPEWRDLKNNAGKTLSKTAKQLLSLIVFRLQVYHNSGSNLQDEELQENYHFFEQSLGVCQRRIRQCMLELQESGFIHLHNATVVKQHIKCRNTPCIKLAKNFQPYLKKFSGEAERNFVSTRKKFQVDNIIDINNKSNISRSSESEFLKNVVDRNEPVQSQEQTPLQEQAEQQVAVFQKLQVQNLQSEGAQAERDINQNEELTKNGNAAATLPSVIRKIADSNGNNSAISPYLNASVPDNNKGWFKRKRLAAFHPLTAKDADLLQIRSNREFNLSFINKLLLKLADQYPNHHFCNKKVVLNYMTKALVHEFRESIKVNNNNFQFKSNDPEKLKEQYLEKVERSLDTSKQAQLKRKIAGIFEPNTAYKLLTSCKFGSVVENQYQLKLLKDIMLLEHIKAKILGQVQLVYGNKIKQLQIIPFVQTTAPKQQIQGEDKKHHNLSGLNKLDPDSVWYKVRRSLIEEHGKYADSSTFSKLAVVEEDKVTSQVILKPTTPFIDYLVRQRYMGDLRLAFQAQNFTFKLEQADKESKLRGL